MWSSAAATTSLVANVYQRMPLSVASLYHFAVFIEVQLLHCKITFY